MGSDLWLHALGGLLITLSLFRLLVLRARGALVQWLFLLLVLAIFSVDEFIQQFVAHRHATWLDWQVTFVGWLLAAVWLMAWRWWLAKRS